MASVSNSTPFTLPEGTGVTTWSKVSAGTNTTQAITQNNYLFAWGNGGGGLIGDGTSVTRSSPVQIGTLFDESSYFEYIQNTNQGVYSWSQLASTISTMAGVTSDGSLYVWGRGSQGELGNNNINATISFPTKLGTSSWSSISAGSTHFAAIRADGGIFTWGNNASGQLGTDDQVHRSSPVQIGTNSYTSVSAGASNTSAIDSTYKLWTWGNNTNGQLGVNDSFARLSPVVVGAINDPGYYSNYFDGTGDFLSIANNAALQFDANFTIEMWLYPTVLSGVKGLFGQRSVESNYSPVLLEFNGASLIYQVSTTGSSWTVNLSSNPLTVNVWTHIALVRDSSSVTLYVNGVSAGSGTASGALMSPVAPTYIGANSGTPSGAGYFTGYISNVRIVKGTAVYTSNFTTPTSPLTAISGTSLLTCQNVTFIDNSTNNFAITAAGNVASTAINPFSNPLSTYVGPSWTQVSTGNSVTAAISSTGSLFVWGASAAGQGGQGLLVHRSSPVQITTFAGNETVINSYVSAVGFSGTVYYSWTAVTSGAVTDLAIRSDGSLWGWGYNADGSLGLNNTSIQVLVPTQIGNTSWSQICSNDGSTFGITSNGLLFAWGLNTFGTLGTNDTVNRSSPVQLGTSSWTALASGGIRASGVFTFAIRSDGALFAWGNNTSGTLGTNDQAYRSSPVQIGTSSWTGVATGITHTVAIRSDGGLFTWGNNANGELGSSSRVHRSSPVQVGTGSWNKVGSGFNHVLATLSTGALFTWGLGTTGQLGSGAAASRSSPVQVGASSWSQVGAGTSWSLAIRTDGSLFSWGFNAAGNLGVGDLLNKSSPVQVGTSSWTLITTNSSSMSAPMAVRTDGRLFIWGQQYNGDPQLYALPNLRFTAISSPVVVTAYTETFNDVCVGASHVTSIRSDSKLFTWGLNTSGQLGDGTAVSRSVPVQIGTGNWNDVNTAGTHTVALNSNNNLFTWGLNTTGQLGDGTIISKSSPVQIGSGVYREIEGSLVNSYAVKNNYAVYGWGTNAQQFGSLGVQGNKSSPTLIATIPDKWNYINTAQAGSFASAVREDGYLFTWGVNTSGQLGSNNALPRSNPTQLGTGAPVGYYSNYFDGTGYLSVADNAAWSFSSGDFTIEAWVFSNTAYSGRIYSQYQSSSNQIAIQIGSNQVRFFQYTGGSFNPDITTSTTLTVGQWNHIAVVRNGNVFTIYINGVARATQTSAITLTDFAAPITVSSYTGTGEFYTGYISNYRIVKGTAVYTSNFTPPTNPLSAISGTVLLICNNSSFTDSSINNFPLTGAGNFSIQTIYPSSFTAPPGGVSNKKWSCASGGNLFTDAITNIGELFTWGDNSAGQLGLEVGLSPTGSWLIPRSSPVQVGTVGFAASPTQIGTSSWVAVTAGTNYAVAKRNDGTLFAWGTNSIYQLGDGTQIHRSSPVQISTSSWVSVAAGDIHSLAIASDRTLYGWGTTGYGGTYTATPYLMPYNSTYGIFTNVSSGTYHSIAIKGDGSLWGWGANTLGQLGTGDTVLRSSPVQIGTSSWIAIAAYADTSSAIRADGLMFMWGANGQGQLGDNTQIHRSSPVQIGTSSWTQLGGESAAIRSDGYLFTWGGNTSGRLGDGTTVFKSSPVQIGTSSWTSVSAAYTHVAAIRSDGRLFAWGDNTSGALGDNTVIWRSSPVQIGTATWVKASAGSYITYGVQSNSTLWTWGNNFSGQIGDPLKIHRSAPAQVGTSLWTTVTAGDGAGFMIRSDGALFGVGTQANGTLGTNDTGSRSSPVSIGTGRSWTMVSASFFTNLRLSTQNELFSVGDNSRGQLGTNDTVTRSSPVQLGTAPVYFSQPQQIDTGSWSVVSAGVSHSLGIKLDNTLWGWGGPAANQFTTYSWKQIVAGNATLAIRSDNKLFAWGQNGFGQLGLGDLVHRSSPVQVGTSSWVSITTGTLSSGAIRSDGALFTWGDGTAGILGSNSQTSRSSPVQVGTNSWVMISIGEGANTANGSTALGIQINGSLWSWGRSDQGQLGDGTLTARSSPVQVGTDSWSLVSATSRLSMFAIRKDGALFGWGQPGAGSLGDNSSVGKSYPQLITSLNNDSEMLSYASQNSIVIQSWSQLAAGASHTLAIRSDGKLFTWGLNNAGQLGDSTVFNRNIPTQIGNSSWSSVGAGTSHSLAVRSDGALFTWGLGTNGELGDNTLISKSSPIQISSSSWTMVTGGVAYSGAIRLDGGLFTWGSSTNGRTGLNDIINRSSPAQVGTSSWTSIASLQATMLGITPNGLLFAWGLNSGGQLGDGVLTTRSSPVQVTSLNTPEDQTTYASYLGITAPSWTQISVNTSHVLAINSQGKLYAWGFNTNGQLGTNDLTNQKIPVQIGDSSWISVGTTASASMAIRSDNTLWTWGLNTAGELGLNDLVSRSSPTQIGTSAWTSVITKSFGNSHVVALRSDGTMFAWGNNASGQLGLGVLGHRSSPVQVGTNSWNSVSAGNSYTAAIRSDGYLFTWGGGLAGRLGDNTSATRSSPVQIGTSSWSQVSAGAGYTYALRIDGGLFTFGDNTGGQLGLNDASNRSSPTQVGTSSWTQIASGAGYGQFAIRSDGGLFTWGNNTNGSLGLSDTISRSSPVQVGTNSWVFVAPGTTNASIAIQADGSIFTWGSNSNGLLGTLKNYLTTSSPVFVTTINDSWSVVGAGAASLTSSAIRNDGKLFMWGINGSGQLGLGDLIHRSSPVQIGTNSWSQVSSGASHTVAITTDKKVFAWGGNSLGQQGNGTTASVSTPTQIDNNSWNMVLAFGTSTVGYQTSNNLLYGWGDNGAGQLGVIRNAPASYSSPVVTGTIYDSWATLVASNFPATNNAFVLGIRNDGLLFTWGYNSTGQLGNNANVHRSTPVQIGNSSWTSVGASSSTSMAIRADNTLWVWGSNNSGGLGLNDTVHRSSPTQLGTYSWSVVPVGPAAAGALLGFAVRSDGVLFGWGNNANLQIGTGDGTNKSSPVQIGSMASYIINPNNYAVPTQIGSSIWSAVSAGNNYSLAIRNTDNVLFVWGYNNSTLLRGSLTNMGYSATQVSSGTSHFGFVKKS